MVFVFLKVMVFRLIFLERLDISNCPLINTMQTVNSIMVFVFLKVVVFRLILLERLDISNWQLIKVTPPAKSNMVIVLSMDLESTVISTTHWPAINSQPINVMLMDNSNMRGVSSPTERLSVISAQPKTCSPVSFLCVLSLTVRMALSLRVPIWWNQWVISRAPPSKITGKPPSMSPSRFTIIPVASRTWRQQRAITN
jgi:hypothetical protein